MSADRNEVSRAITIIYKDLKFNSGSNDKYHNQLKALSNELCANCVFFNLKINPTYIGLTCDKRRQPINEARDMRRGGKQQCPDKITNPQETS